MMLMAKPVVNHPQTSGRSPSAVISDYVGIIYVLHDATGYSEPVHWFSSIKYHI